MIRTYTPEELAQIISEHTKYIETGGKEGAIANLSRANLSGVNLRSANLRSANLSSADLSWANLSGVNLRSADLSSANLSWANLRSADLSSANLSGANLSGADLRSADLSSANLSEADLSWANLSGANLRSADLSWVNLSWVIGNRKEICSGQFGPYSFAYTAEALAIGCTQFTHAEWAAWEPSESQKKDWETYSPLLFQIIELCPATPFVAAEAKIVAV
jgi:Pentapeptide repeats (8 copies)